MKKSKYFYEDACDFLCCIGGYRGMGGGYAKLDRPDAIRIIQTIAKAIKMDEKELANKISRSYNGDDDG